ncbi:hypothetical protein E2C01_069641 [Portunus trituberculatus]|uniref:Uncharacterized protein n=1 Tax=Portunus trituberculatus TaxID=210409 RepID=A0A5B7I1C5_PORTR|nr:hypothetical protein [Portunus trituberculatus]
MFQGPERTAGNITAQATIFFPSIGNITPPIHSSHIYKELLSLFSDKSMPSVDFRPNDSLRMPPAAQVHTSRRGTVAATQRGRLTGIPGELKDNK